MVSFRMARFLLIGVGPHARRTYIPHLRGFQSEDKAQLVCAVDLEAIETEVIRYRDENFPLLELQFVPRFTTNMPDVVAQKLQEIVTRLKVDCIIIATEPLAHKAYGMWALEQGLHVIMDKPISTRTGVTTDPTQAYGISQDFEELYQSYRSLQTRRQTMFLVNSHRRYHPGFQFTFDKIAEISRITGCPVTNIITSHCDGQWRLPTEIVEQDYHSYNVGHGKVSHSGYHFLDTLYRFVKAGWRGTKRPDKIEVVSSFLLPNGFLRCLTYDDYARVFGQTEYAEVCKFTDKELKSRMADFGEMDASVQISFISDDEVVTLAQLNLQHNGFARRTWIKPGQDLYKGNGRVKHEFHDIKNGPFQTIVIESRQANDKHDRVKVSTAKLGSDNHFAIHQFRNCGVLPGGDEPLISYSVADLDKHTQATMPGLYSENIKRGVLNEALAFMEGTITLADLASNLDDHSVPANVMSAIYLSHIQRISGLNPIVSIDLSYDTEISPSTSLSEECNSVIRPLTFFPDTGSAIASIRVLPTMARVDSFAPSPSKEYSPN